MGKNTQLAKEEEYNGNSWNETRNFYPADRKLREKGYQIVERKQGQEALWGKHGSEPLTETEALREYLG